MQQSSDLFERAKRLIPGGVNSPVRAFQGVGGTPVFIDAGQGPYLFDTEGKRYIDYVCSWGCAILGHAHPKVLAAIAAAIQKGLGFGTPTDIEIRHAEKIQQLMPSIEMVRMVNSGTEATLSAIRLARGFTQRCKVIKFIGCYHGHHDALLVKAGSGAMTLGVPDSAGVPAAVTHDTILVPYNDSDALADAFATYANDIAAVIVEPVAGNMNLVLPKAGFLQRCRELCTQAESVLIFDEVMTGFRVALGGAQALYDVKPDLTCLGKVIGGGLPVGAFGGRREIMQQLAPLGPVYQAGTLSGNPITMTAGLATLECLTQHDYFPELNAHCELLMQGLQEIANRYGIPLQTRRAGAMFGFSFEADPERHRFKAFYHQALAAGIYFAPSAFEAGFLSITHTASVITETLERCENCFARLMEPQA